MSFFYREHLASMRNEAIASAYSPKWIAGKIFNECCLDAARHSHFEAFETQMEAFTAALEHVGDYDLSTTEYYRPEDIDVEDGEPAYERLESELKSTGSVQLGDYEIILEELTDDEIEVALRAAALAAESEEIE